MRRVQTLKYLGLQINDEGRLKSDVNIDPIVNAMSSISKTLSTVTSTLLGRALYAKYLLASKYIHRIQNYNFGTEELRKLRGTVLDMTWAELEQIQQQKECT